MDRKINFSPEAKKRMKEIVSYYRKSGQKKPLKILHFTLNNKLKSFYHFLNRIH